jgi:hypothetical protein
LVDFVLYELIRYAETKAIFSFQVVCEARDEPCVLLRLLSWDSEAATHSDGTAVPGGVDSLMTVEWRRLVQVLYEETSVAGRESDQEEFQWTWTKDWCCLPASKEEKTEETPVDLPASVVRLYLSLDEHEQLRRDLRLASDWYSSEEAKQATIMSKIGRLSAKVGLAAILL